MQLMQKVKTKQNIQVTEFNKIYDEFLQMVLKYAIGIFNPIKKEMPKDISLNYIAKFAVI